MNIINEIGLPAALEQCAEECSELAQACLKLSRKLRDENPTPKSRDEIVESLEEEIADVLNCIYLIQTPLMIFDDELADIMLDKRDRWIERIKEHKEHKELKGDI